MGNASLFIIRSYLLAGKLLHIICLVEILVITMLLPYLHNLETTSVFAFGLKYFAIIYFASLPIFSQLDARSRFQNYKQIKDQFFIYGYDERILKPVLKSRCQRDAALLSADDLGYGEKCRKHFRSCGYKWYHLIPDFFIKQPQFLFAKYFWKTTFFTPTYTPKVNYLDEAPDYVNPNKIICANGNQTTC